ncbi:hypothetical protein [Mycolicibacterium sp. 120270]|uniref:hypothetical protein n=1 Tax=Mycolicibacterium sp. 120270 TaxID=3090600 RepID=UPI00299DDEBF|nr:hypothetical protein [Mycolicibacterium sp. 120270]MDX1887867.1 hypothetical protein [Mycolicibacterium sp. 120270]
MRTSPRSAAAVLTVAVALGVAPVASADPAPPALIDCGPYGGMSKALEAAAEHASPPLGTPAPLPPGLRTDPPLRCK